MSPVSKEAAEWLNKAELEASKLHNTTEAMHQEIHKLQISWTDRPHKIGECICVACEQVCPDCEEEEEWDVDNV